MGPPTPSGERRGERGYGLAALVGVLAVLAIALGAALPVWAARIQRGREAELVARGLQYAEAIRVFQRRFGRLPNRLEELVELEPRSIRRLWTNPMSREAGGWRRTGAFSDDVGTGSSNKMRHDRDLERIPIRSDRIEMRSSAGHVTPGMAVRTAA